VNQAAMIKVAFDAQRQFLSCASKCKPPSQQILETLLKPTSVQISAVQVSVIRRTTSLHDGLTAFYVLTVLPCGAF